MGASVAVPVARRCTAQHHHRVAFRTSPQIRYAIPIYHYAISICREAGMQYFELQMQSAATEKPCCCSAPYPTKPIRPLVVFRVTMFIQSGYTL